MRCLFTEQWAVFMIYTSLQPVPRCPPCHTPKAPPLPITHSLTNKFENNANLIYYIYEYQTLAVSSRILKFLTVVRLKINRKLEI